MTTYVFDTSAFRVMRHYYPATFGTLWENLDDLVKAGGIQSVREVWNELRDFNDDAFIVDRADQRKAIFAVPSADEQLAVQAIFAVPHFQALISQKAILKGKAVADPFVGAAAQVKKATVITQEGLKPNAAKIPNVCAHFGVPCEDLEWFMAQQGWSF